MKVGISSACLLLIVITASGIYLRAGVRRRSEVQPIGGPKGSQASRNTPSLAVRDSEQAAEASERNASDHSSHSADKDVSSSFAALDAGSDLIRRGKLRIKLATSILQRDFGKVSEVLKYLESSQERHTVLLSIIPGLIRANRSDTMDIISKQLVGGDRNIALRSVVTELAGSGDLSGAMDTQVKMAFSDDRNNAIAAIAAHAAQGDTSKVLQWMDGLLPDEKPIANRFLTEAIRERRDEDGLRQLLERSTDSRDRTSLIKSITAFAVQRGDPESALEFSGTLTGAEREIAKGTFLLFAKQLPLNEGIRAASALNDPQAKSDTISALVWRELEKDPERAAKAVLALPSDIAESAMSPLVRNWLRTDADRASQWVSDLPTGRRRDLAIQALAYDLMHTDRAAARQSASAISDKNLRDKVLRSIP